MSFVYHSYVLVCHLYITRLYSYVIWISFVCTRMPSLCTRILSSCVTRMYLYLIHMSLVCTRMSFVCHSHVIVCHSYVTRLWFNHEPHIPALVISFLLHAFFYKQRFFSTQPQCCLTSSWIELQMLLRCCLIHITIIIPRKILYLVSLCLCLGQGLFMSYLCHLFFIFSLIFIVINRPRLNRRTCFLSIF